MMRVKVRMKRAWRPLSPCLAAAVIAGCSLSDKAIDDALNTGTISLADASPSIATTPFEPGADGDLSAIDRLIDEDTIRLAVTTADLDRLQDGRLPWASAATGSSGIVGDITQSRQAGQVCRLFHATRQAYDGVSAYRGEVCLDPRAGWWTRSMDRDRG